MCAQEFCYSEKLPVLIKAYIGSGKVLPINRGAGIDQKLLLDFTRRLSSGEWCHIFPEAGVWQKKSALGGRVQGVEAKGKLKWGVGKMIAHSAVTPVVIPFCHVGMEDVMPQDPVTRKTLTPVPLPGRHSVTVLFGEEISFQDLLEEHEEKYGKLRKCQARSGSSVCKDTVTEKGGEGGGCGGGESEGEEWLRHWKSSDAERDLYHCITRRIEQKMECLLVQLRQT